MSFPQGHALLIGVGTHQHCPWLDLHSTAAEAEAVGKVLQNGEACGYPADQVRLVTRAGATRAGILAALDDLVGRVGAGDTVTLFFSGHGALGSDDSYHLAGHDVEMETNRIKAGTGISEEELLRRLRDITAERVLVVFNACHGGTIAPVRLDAAEIAATALTTGNPPDDTVAALLGTGTGRIVIAACRAGQRSHTGSGELSLFAQALVDGLAGNGAPATGGFIDAFGLYAHLYASVAERARTLLNEDQEPELSVLRGSGSFAVGLYKGAGAAGQATTAEPAAAPLPQGTAVREVDPAESARSLAERIGGTGEESGDQDGPDLGLLDDSDFVIGNIRK